MECPLRYFALPVNLPATQSSVSLPYLVKQPSSFVLIFALKTCCWLFEMDQAELFWALLDAGEFEDVKKLNLEEFDWTTLHPTEGCTALISCITRAISNAHDKDASERAFSAIEWLIRSGASTSQKCPKHTKVCYSIWCTDNKEDKVEINCAGHSAISYVMALRKHIQDKPKWTGQLSYLGKVLKCFVSTSTGSSPDRVSIPQGITEIWEKFLAAKEAHDLTIQTADGRVTAHAQMLKEASPVVRAMLESPMKERKDHCIEVKDTPSSGVSLFLEMLVGKSTIYWPFFC